MAKQDTVKMTVYLAPEQYEALRQEAFERRSKITALIREAIDIWLKAEKEKDK